MPQGQVLVITDYSSLVGVASCQANSVCSISLYSSGGIQHDFAGALADASGNVFISRQVTIVMGPGSYPILVGDVGWTMKSPPPEFVVHGYLTPQ